jgi:hypothetical protein
MAAARMRPFPTLQCAANAQCGIRGNPSISSFHLKEAMATSSILGGDYPPMEPKGTDVDSLGPSDTSDSGSDVRTSRERSAIPEDAAEGAVPVAHESSSDAEGTGERASADAPPVEPDADILPDRIGIVPGSGADMTASADQEDAGMPDELADEAREPEDDEGSDRGA